MSRRLAVVRYDVLPIEAKFYGNCRSLKATIIANPRPHSLPSFFPQVEWVYPKYTKIFPKGIPWTCIEGLEKFLKNVDIVNSLETYSFLSHQCAKICEKSGKKLVTSVFETIPNHVYNFFPLYFRNTRSVIRTTDLFILLTEQAKVYLKSLSVPEEKLKVVYYGIDTDQFCPPEKRKQNDVPRILFVGILAPNKGLLEILEAFSILFKEGIRAELWVCGKGKLEPLVKSYSKKFPVKYLGVIEYEKLPIIYKQCDIFCLPSRDRRILGFKIWEEQFGFALVEAMSSGLPIVSSNCGAISEVVGQGNLVVNQGSSSELYSALKELILSESKCHEIGRINRERAVEMFDARKQCKKLERELMEL